MMQERKEERCCVKDYEYTITTEICQEEAYMAKKRPREFKGNRKKRPST